ncbi:GGDEF domain-containing protein [soil metagenome]
MYGDDRVGLGGQVTAATGFWLGAVQRLAGVRQWGVWSLPAKPRALVLLIDVAAVLVGVALLVRFELRLADVRTFALFLGCAAVSVEATRRVSERSDDVAQDIVAIWLIPTAIVAGPFYALLSAAGVMWHTQRRVRRVEPMKRVLDAATHGLAAAAAAGVFLVGGSVVGATSTTGPLAVAGAVLVLTSALIFVIVNVLLVCSVIRAAVPDTTWRKLVFSSESLNMTAAEACGAVVVLATWRLSPWLVPVVVAPMVLLQRGLSFAELQSKARIDTTTGLPRVEAWRKLAERLFVRSRTSGTNLSLLMLDIDHFKAINDEHGHLTGDRALTAVATAVQDAIRPGDLAGRYGGEEFAVVLPGADYTAAVEVAERIRRTVAALSLNPLLDDPDRSYQLRVTVSVGVARLSPDTGSVDHLIDQADRAMYAAKGSGRNRVHGLIDVSDAGDDALTRSVNSPDLTSIWTLNRR